MVDHSRFDAALIHINKNAEKAGFKLIYSTSLIGPSIASPKLLRSFNSLNIEILKIENIKEFDPGHTNKKSTAQRCKINKNEV